MRIDSLYNQLSLQSLTAKKRSQEADPATLQASPQAALTEGANSSAGANSSKVETAQDKADAAAQARREELRAQLQEYLDKSPAEHMRDAILKEMGMSEEDLAALPPEKREAIESDIARKMRERLLAKDEAHPDATTLQDATMARLSQSQGGAAAGGQGNGQNDGLGNGQSPAGIAAYALLQAAVNGKSGSSS